MESLHISPTPLFYLQQHRQHSPLHIVLSSSSRLVSSQRVHGSTLLSRRHAPEYNSFLSSQLRATDNNAGENSSRGTTLDNSTDLESVAEVPSLTSTSHNTAQPSLPKATKTKSSKHKWKADNFQNDYRLLKTAIARQNAIPNLQQQQRKYMLDGFARNRRPLIRDVIWNVGRIAAWAVFLIAGSDAAISGGIVSWRRKLHIASAKAILVMTVLHHWIIGMVLPLFLLTWAKRYDKSTNNTHVNRDEQMTASTKRRRILNPLKRIGKYGSSARTLEEFTKSNANEATSGPLFFYSSQLSNKSLHSKDTKDFSLCLLENWSSAVIGSFIWGAMSILVSLGKMRRLSVSVGEMCSQSMTSSLQSTPTIVRFVTRIGAAAALHQYPSLLFELRRDDQPRPLCRPTTLVQCAGSVFLRYLPVCVASDVAVLFGKKFVGRSLQLNIATGFSVIAPVCHVVALMRIIRVSKCNAISLSEATSFPDTQDGEHSVDEERKEVKWRYQLRWRTPQRIAQTLRSWSTFFLTGHVPLLMEMDEWKKELIRSDGYSTEGTRFQSRDTKESSKKTSDYDNDELILHADEITESLSLIFRDRDAAIFNATQARFSKHQQSFDTKTLDDVLGVAVQQTFGIGISYDFDHFDTPSDEQEISIHQLRARMAKSAIRKKKEFENAMIDELDVLHSLRDNVVTTENEQYATTEMQEVQQGIRERYSKKIDQLSNALMTLIPTNADAPPGSERYESPIMIAEYVNVTAPALERSDLQATIGPAPDSLSQIEQYVRNDYGDAAAEAFRQEELAFRSKEREMMSNFRQRYGRLKKADEDNKSMKEL